VSTPEVPHAPLTAAWEEAFGPRSLLVATATP
jgi:hypothetical protein